MSWAYPNHNQFWPYLTIGIPKTPCWTSMIPSLKLTCQCPLKINGWKLEDVFPIEIVSFLGDIRSFSWVHVSDLTWTISKFHTPRTSTVPTLLVVSSVISLKTFMCISSNSSTACDSGKNHFKKKNWIYGWFTFFQADLFFLTEKKLET